MLIICLHIAEIIGGVAIAIIMPILGAHPGAEYQGPKKSTDQEDQ